MYLEVKKTLANMYWTKWKNKKAFLQVFLDTVDQLQDSFEAVVALGDAYVTLFEVKGI